MHSKPRCPDVRPNTRRGLSFLPITNGFRNLAVSQIIADTLDDMNLKLPKPTVDLEEIRRLYHKDTAAQGHGKTAAKGGVK
jgi:hypothetical protein